MPAIDETEFTESERVAKQMFIHLLKNGFKQPCDTDILEAELPSWYNEEKYKKGQEFFQNNRAGILQSNLIGLLCLLFDPKGLKILHGTGRSSTAETARRRYLLTVLHTLSWYDIDLSPGSESRKSLSIVRKLHFLSSKSSKEKGLGEIHQAELSLTAFGFMGFPLIRPHLLAIKYDEQENREAFIHLWSVLLYMIGVKDEFNICLLPYDGLEVLLKMFLRYILIPSVQIESPLYKEMAIALLDGMNKFLPNLNYDSQIYMVRKLCCVPGYQRNVDVNKEILCRSLLTQSDIDECIKENENTVGIERVLLFVDIPIFEVKSVENYENVKDSFIDIGKSHRNISLAKSIHSSMNLSSTEAVVVRFIDYEKDWKNNLGDLYFEKLNPNAQIRIKAAEWVQTILNIRITRFIFEFFLTKLLDRMKSAQYEK